MIGSPRITLISKTTTDWQDNNRVLLYLDKQRCCGLRGETLDIRCDTVAQCTPIRQHLLLIGDAARLADPFLGEGIYYAIKSATIASQALLDAYDTPTVHAGKQYAQRLQETIKELHTALKIARMLYCFPHYGYDLFKTQPKLATGYFQVLCGDLSITEFYRTLRRTAFSKVFRSTRWLHDIQYRIPVITGPPEPIPERETVGKRP